MTGDRLVAMLFRAALETAMRHLPRWLARRGGGDGNGRRGPAARDRDLARKLRLTRRLMRFLR